MVLLNFSEPQSFYKWTTTFFCLPLEVFSCILGNSLPRNTEWGGSFVWEDWPRRGSLPISWKGLLEHVSFFMHVRRLRLQEVNAPNCCFRQSLQSFVTSGCEYSWLLSLFCAQSNHNNQTIENPKTSSTRTNPKQSHEEHTNHKDEI